MRGGVVLLVVAAVFASLTTGPSARADDDEPEPHAGYRCFENHYGALTDDPGSKSAWLSCPTPKTGMGSSVWKRVGTNSTVSKWLSLEPEGPHSNEIFRTAILEPERGTVWSGTPQTRVARCVVQQNPPSGSVKDRSIVQRSAYGLPMLFEVRPDFYSVAFSGHCLWVRMRQ